jgi:hypothetical protein
MMPTAMMPMVKDARSFWLVNDCQAMRMFSTEVGEIHVIVSENRDYRRWEKVFVKS